MFAEEERESLNQYTTDTPKSSFWTPLIVFVGVGGVVYALINMIDFLILLID
jgi:hypothetical protein